MPRRSIIDRLIDALRREIARVNRELRADGEGEMPKITLTLLGQFALFADPRVREAIDLHATRDVDAWIEGGRNARTVVRDALRGLDLEYDYLSREIWMPSDAKANLIYESPELALKAFDPVSVIVSKAIKAPKRNRYIVRQALLLYGEDLSAAISRCGGEPACFVSGNEDE